MSESQSDAGFLEALNEAQRVGQSACAAVFETLQAGMTHDDIAEALVAEIQRGGAQCEDQPIIRMGVETGGGLLSRALLANTTLKSGDVVFMAARPIVGNAVGEYGDTQVYGENGRYWQFRRMAYRIFQTFLDGLGTCTTEREIIRFADDCAYQRGFALFHPLSGSIAHHLSPGDARSERIKHNKALVANRLRRLMPGSDRAFEGPWCVEPRFLVADVGYAFKCVVQKQGGDVVVVGPELPGGVPTGPWLA